MNPEEIQIELRKLSNEVASLSNTVKEAALKSESETKKPKSKLEGWGNSVTIIVGVLSAIAILFTQLKQPQNVSADTQEKISAARKNNAEAMKIEQDLQLALDSLRMKGSKDVNAYNELLEDKLPRLQTVINRFESNRLQTQNQNILFKYVIIWVIFIGLGWLFRIIYTLWSSLLNIISVYLSKLASSAKKENRRTHLWNLQRYLMFLNPVPTILEVIIDIKIFFVLIVPLFNETAASLGSDKTFQSVSKEFTHLNIRSAIDSARSIIITDTVPRNNK